MTLHISITDERRGVTHEYLLIPCTTSACPQRLWGDLQTWDVISLKFSNNFCWRAKLSSFFALLWPCASLYMREPLKGCSSAYGTCTSYNKKTHTGGKVKKKDNKTGRTPDQNPFMLGHLRHWRRNGPKHQINKKNQQCGGLIHTLPVYKVQMFGNRIFAYNTMHNNIQPNGLNYRQ